VFYILWRFETTEERRAAFTEAYGPAGPWVRFFKEAEGYLETELFQRSTQPLCYLTLDRWESREAYEAFRRRRAEEYSALDQACEDLTVREQFLAAWEA
jgi:heme-degrading monooxygenase HmoA